MNTIGSVLAVIRDLVRLTIVEPVREGRLRSAGWPPGLAALMFCSLGVYAALALAVILAGPLREADVLLVTSDGATIPELGVMLCTGASVLALALALTAALHLPWWVKLATGLSVVPIVFFFVSTIAIDPVMLLFSAAGLLVVFVLTLLRWRATYAWWEFVVVALALGTAIFVPTLLSGVARSVSVDVRATALAGAMQSLVVLAFPALFVAGAALAQIAVTASFAAITAGARELGPRTQQLVAVLLLGWALVTLVQAFVDAENTPGGWLASGAQLAALCLVWVAVMSYARRVPGWGDLDEDSTRLNYLVAIACVSYLFVSPVVALLGELARYAGIGWLFAVLDAFQSLTRTDWIVSAVRSLVGGVGLVLALPLARRGRPWAALFLGALFVMAAFDLLRVSGAPQWAGESVPQFAGLLSIATLALAAAQLLSGRLTGMRAIALLCALLLCLVFPHRAILDDPISALLGFSGLGAALFGLIWRVLTEGDITNAGTPRWPIPARVMLFCASSLVAVTSTAVMALSRGSGRGSIDITLYTEAGDSLLGTPLFLTAVIGCLAIAIVPAKVRQPSAG